MPTLRSKALRIASELPEDDPTRRKLLATLKSAFTSTNGIQIDLDEYRAVYYVVFASYGRIHHITGDLKQWEKNLQSAVTKAAGLLNGRGVFVDQGEVSAQPFNGKTRTMQMECVIKPAAYGDWGMPLGELDALLGSRFKRSPMPTAK